MIDSHSHIYCDAFDEDRDAVVQRAREADVRHIVLPGESIDSVPLQVALHKKYPDYISLAFGLHPEEVNGDYLTALEQLRPRLNEHPIVAVGEIVGLQGDGVVGIDAEFGGLAVAVVHRTGGKAHTPTARKF